MHFNSTYGRQTWQGSDLGWRIPFTKPRQRLTKWSRGHYLLNVFKTSVANVTIISSLLKVVLPR